MEENNFYVQSALDDKYIISRPSTNEVKDHECTEQEVYSVYTKCKKINEGNELLEYLIKITEKEELGDIDTDYITKAISSIDSTLLIPIINCIRAVVEDKVYDIIEHLKDDLDNIATKKTEVHDDGYNLEEEDDGTKLEVLFDSDKE